MKKRYFENEKISEIKLNGEIISDYEFVDCEFINCSMENCKLIECTFSSCKFDKCSASNLETQYSMIKYAEFSNCTLVGIEWSTLCPMDSLAEPISKIQSCHLKYNSFTNMSLRKFQFIDTTIKESIFGECELVGCCFKRCNLEGTEFVKCDLQKADFRNAIGYRIDITTSKIKAARFSYSEAINLLDCFNIKIE